MSAECCQTSIQHTLHPVQFVLAWCSRPVRIRPTNGKVHRHHQLAIVNDNDEQHAIDTGEQPVFLATLGSVAEHTARATFATNLLAAGGIRVETASYDGQPVVCVAGTDAAYDESGAETAAALREAGAVRVIVAGKPRDWADDSCAMGEDALAFLRRTREALA